MFIAILFALGAANLEAPVQSQAEKPKPMTIVEKRKRIAEFREQHCKPINWGQSFEVRDFDRTSPNMRLQITC